MAICGRRVVQLISNSQFACFKVINESRSENEYLSCNKAYMCVLCVHICLFVCEGLLYSICNSIGPVLQVHQAYVRKYNVYAHAYRLQSKSED